MSSPRHHWIRCPAGLAIPALITLALGGCASTIADLPVVGLPENVPARPMAQGEYLPVHDVPPARTEKVMTPEQVDKAEKELVDVRNRQAFGAQKPSAKGSKKSDPTPPKAAQSQN